MDSTGQETGTADIVGGVPQPHVVRAVAAHMNADHAADCVAICQLVSGRPTISSARLVTLDDTGLEFEVEADGATTSLRVPWRRPIVERADIRHQVAEMTHTARALQAEVDPNPTYPGPAATAVLVVALLVVALLGGRVPAHAQMTPDPTVAPVTTLSPDGRTATDGIRSLTVSQVTELDPAGHPVTVTGRGFDTAKGIYAAFCLVPATNQVPSPCGGGADTTGATGASSWISSDPPTYADGLARPYGAGGTFTIEISLSPVLGGGLDCRLVRCAIVTRNDHTRSADRSQDIIVPVTFRADPVPSGVGPDPTTPTAPPTTTPPPTTAITTTTTPPAPPTELSADGTRVTDGVRTLAISRVVDLAPDGASLVVSGSGFDATRGVYVSLCRVPRGAARPGPCLAGSASASVWVTSDPPDHAEDLAVPYGADGDFEVEIQVVATIDAETDCRVVECGVVVRSDHQAPDDRSLDLVVPVQFGAPAAAPTTVDIVEDGGDDLTAAPGPPTGEEQGGSGSGFVAALVAVAAAVVLGGASFRWTRRRRTIIGPAA